MVQRGTRLGARLGVVLGFANLLTFVVFALYLRPDFNAPFSWMDLLAVFSGLMFFFGQWFSILSVRKGDLVVHSSALGLKVLMVVALSAGVGLEKAGPGLIAGSVLAAVAVFLVAGATVERWRANQVTVWLTVVACVFFALNDFLTGWQSQAIGYARWLMILMGTTGFLSLFMLGSHWRDVRETFSDSAVAWPVVGAGVVLGVQALVVNLAFSLYAKPALSNVAFSTRGVMAVVFVWLVTSRGKAFLSGRQLVGAVLMVIALGVVLM